MVAFAFKQSRPLYSEHPIIKGIVGLGELSFLFSLHYQLDHDLRARLIRELVFEMVEHFSESGTRLLHLGVTCLYGGFQILFLCFATIGLLNLHPTPINQCSIAHHRRDRRLKSRHPPFHVIITLARPVNLWSPLMMHQRPIQRNHFAPAILMLWRNQRPMAWQ